MSHPQGPPPPAQPQLHGQLGSQPPPPQYAQVGSQPQYAQLGPQPQYSQPTTVVYQQPQTVIGFGGMQAEETCPNCHKRVMMSRDRSPSGMAWLLGILACIFLCSVGIGFVICIWLLACSPLATYDYTCPLCGHVARTVNQGC